MVLTFNHFQGEKKHVRYDLVRLIIIDLLFIQKLILNRTA